MPGDCWKHKKGVVAAKNAATTPTFSIIDPAAFLNRILPL